MTCPSLLPNWTKPALLLLAAFFGALAPTTSARAATPADPAISPGAEKIVSTEPMRLAAENGKVAGRLVVAPEILSADNALDLVYTIVGEPLFGRVGMAGEGDETDFFANKTSRFGYFAYQARDDYTGEDAFTYTVRNTTSGLVYENRVVIQVPPPEPVVLDQFVVKAERDRTLTATPVTLNTRPKTPVVQKIPSHQDFMREADRIAVANPKIVFVLDEKARPQHGTAKLDPRTGELRYSPNPGFIGEDRFRYYTTDENNPALGVDNTVTATVFWYTRPVVSLRTV